jgi:hypothetical protein
MTVPRIVVVVLVLAALFLACTGYAAGRLHQWHRRRSDRDAAYREGYEIATRKTFSLAARIIGPRRDRSAVRGAASVPPPPPFPSTPSPSTPSPSTTAAPGPLSSAASPSGPGTRADALADVPTANSGATDVPLATALGSVARPISRRAAARSRRFHSIFPKPSITPSAGDAPTPSAGAVPTRSPGAVPTPSAGTLATPSGAARTDPLQHPAAEVAAEFAVPAERTPTQTPKHPAAAAPQHAASDEAPAEASVRPPASASDKDARPGRHLVPDELVRAATYRLAPDRVARAKVPGAQSTAGAEGDPTVPTAVPKPRRHPADDHAGGPATS